MSHHAAFSTRIRRQIVLKVPLAGYSGAIHGKAEDQISVKDKGYLHDSAFLAERGCLGPANLPRHPAPAHQH
jgi:hypothetical protein